MTTRSSGPVRSIVWIGGNAPLKQASTTLPRTETIVPGLVVLFFIFMTADSVSRREGCD